MIIGFLRSPRWKTPVMSFIDEYCTVFDDEEEILENDEDHVENLDDPKMET